MKTYKIIFCCAAALVVSAVSSAQKLDPTVSVTKDYDAKLLDVDKPFMKVDMPDSLTSFNLNFDYTVLDSKFNGSYEFTPYLLDMRPNPDSYNEKRFWLRAGAGYTLNPTFDLLWSPRTRGKFRTSIYARHDSYCGNYYRPDLETKAFGYDLDSRVGVNGRYDWSTGAFSFDAAYMDISTNDPLVYGFRKNYDAADISARVHSVRDDANYLLYDVRLGVRYGSENLRSMPSEVSLIGFAGAVNEFAMKLDSRLGPVFNTRHGVFVDLDMNVLTYGRSLGTHGGNFAFVPKYAYRTDRLNLEAGVRFDFFLSRLGVNELTGNRLYTDRGQFVYPDVRFDFAILRDWLDVYAIIGGGNHATGYSELLERNHHFSLAFNRHEAKDGFDSPLFENSGRAVDARLGFRGSVNSVFSWDLYGGYVYNSNSPLEAVAGALPLLWYGDYGMAFAGLKAGLRTERMAIDGNFDYRKVGALPENVVAPASVSGQFRFEYNWLNRIYAGLDIDASSARGVLPWYCDLGLDFEYRFKQGMGVWLSASNLLNQKIQRNACFVELGPKITAGICIIL